MPKRGCCEFHHRDLGHMSTSVEQPSSTWPREATCVDGFFSSLNWHHFGTCFCLVTGQRMDEFTVSRVCHPQIGVGRNTFSHFHATQRHLDLSRHIHPELNERLQSSEVVHGRLGPFISFSQEITLASYSKTVLCSVTSACIVYGKSERSGMLD